MTGDCVALGIDRAGRLIQTKPAYGGNIVSIIMGTTTPQLATVRPRMFEPLEPRDVASRVEKIDVGQLPDPSARLVERKDALAWDLDEADVVVCVGPEAGELPALPAGIALGGTREVCKEGLLPRNRQLGLFGRPVAPRLLITVGVPGDFEQLTGFVKARVIASVNGGSGMEEAADVVLRGDPAELVPSLVSRP
jgi:electron transfer flavoprotein alpha subunit